jgi:WXG100 family type VII secretion target
MTTFKVMTMELQQAAADCTNTNTEIQAQVQNVLTFVDSLIASGYQGPCANQLVGVAESWYSDASNLNTVLTEIASNLMTSANNYNGNESQNTTNLSRVGTTLPSGRF